MLGLSARSIHGVKTRIAQPGARTASAAMLHADSAPPEELERTRRERSAELARFAWDSTVFYRDRYREAGISRRDLDDPDTFDHLPVISKEELRSRAGEFEVASVAEKLRLPSSTGGSTGEPLRLLHDSRAPVAAMWWRVYRWWGIHPGDNRAVIQRERRSTRAQIAETVQWWPTVQISLDARQMTDATMLDFARRWVSSRPALLNGYVGGVHEFASWVQQTETVLPSPRAVGVTAAPITASQRQHIEQVFSAPVYDQYRSAEVPWIAAECQAHSGLHLLADLRRIDILDEADRPVPDGETGDVVVTDFANRVFPLVRYRLGDRSSLVGGLCPCGKTLPRLAAIEGRVSDVLRLPGGQAISGGLTGLFNARPDAVTQFQVHQLADYSIVLRCVLGGAPDAADVVSRVAAQLSGIVRDEVSVTVEVVSVIPHDRGKARVIRSDLAVTA